SDVVNYTPTAGSTNTIDFGTSQITSNAVGSAIVAVNGVETINMLGAVGETYVVNNYGSATDVKTLNLTSGDKITVNTTSGPDTINYTPLSSTSANITRTANDAAINIKSFNNTDGNLVIANPGNIDALNVFGSAGGDTINIVSPVAGTTRTTVNVANNT